MNERIKKLRNNLNLTMKKFGENLGVSESAVSRMESGQYKITETLVKLIIKHFNVNEEWLKTGKGEMYITDKESKRAYLIGKYLAENDKFKLKVIDFMLEASDEDWDLFKKFVDKVATES